MNAGHILGVITARGGSKRLPGKNLLPVNGKPLLAYTCAAALDSALLTRTILSTDDEVIADVGRSCGVEIPFLRPAQLARDDTPSLDVIAHLLAELEKREHAVPEIVVLLQPTSPLRTALHIDDGVRLLQKTGADSVVSVCAIPHALAPDMAMRIVNGQLEPAPGTAPSSAETFYGRNGALYVFRTSAFLRSENRYGVDCRALIMSPEDSLDIDSAFDLLLAEKLLRDRVKYERVPR